MTATQYTTFILRALGYDDKEGDFTWDKAPGKALEIGLIDEVTKAEYDGGGDYLRDSAAGISYVALAQPVKGEEKTLGDTIEMPGRPEGEKPAYTTSAADYTVDGEGAARIVSLAQLQAAMADESVAEVIVTAGFTIPEGTVLELTKYISIEGCSVVNNGVISYEFGCGVALMDATLTNNGTINNGDTINIFRGGKLINTGSITGLKNPDMFPAYHSVIIVDYDKESCGELRNSGTLDDAVIVNCYVGDGTEADPDLIPIAETDAAGDSYHSANIESFDGLKRALGMGYGVTVCGNVTITEDIRIPRDINVTVPRGWFDGEKVIYSSLTVAPGAAVTCEGWFSVGRTTLTVEEGATIALEQGGFIMVENGGTLDQRGEITLAHSSEEWYMNDSGWIDLYPGATYIKDGVTIVGEGGALDTGENGTVGISGPPLDAAEGPYFVFVNGDVTAGDFDWSGYHFIIGDDCVLTVPDGAVVTVGGYEIRGELIGELDAPYEEPTEEDA